MADHPIAMFPFLVVMYMRLARAEERCSKDLWYSEHYALLPRLNPETGFTAIGSLARELSDDA
jgi:hypothetical protein